MKYQPDALSFGPDIDEQFAKFKTLLQ
jgi:hypothetical protein